MIELPNEKQLDPLDPRLIQIKNEKFRSDSNSKELGLTLMIQFDYALSSVEDGEEDWKTDQSV
jgi:hypothetical protein